MKIARDSPPEVPSKLFCSSDIFRLRFFVDVRLTMCDFGKLLSYRSLIWAFSRLTRLKLVGLVAYFQRHQYHPWAIPESPWVSRRKWSFMTGMIWGYAHFWKPPPKYQGINESGIVCMQLLSQKAPARCHIAVGPHDFGRSASIQALRKKSFLQVLSYLRMATTEVLLVYPIYSMYGFVYQHLCHKWAKCR